MQRKAQWLSVVDVLWVRAWLAALTELFLRLLCKKRMFQRSADFKKGLKPGNEILVVEYLFTILEIRH